MMSTRCVLVFSFVENIGLGMLVFSWLKTCIDSPMTYIVNSF